ncbi:UNVERIFIED_CONTAM: hypothetical protein K2H54_038105 [Gekko kuhli]
MLRSVGYFRSFSCPFDTCGCQRPYCQYRHKSGRREQLFHAQQQPPSSGSPSLGLAKNIQGLERINKVSQSVKTKVEEGQKELLCYNLGQDDFRNSLAPAIDDPKGNRHFSDESHLSNTLTKDNVNVISTLNDSYKSNKYILDCSCPATDLEYDPLLNYSAGLLKSSFKEEDKNDNQQVKRFSGGNLQGSTIKSPCENKYGFPRKRPRSSSPIKLEIKLQKTNDDMLVIDAPPVNVSKKPRIIKSCKKWKKAENELSFGSKAKALKSSEKSKSSYCIEGKKPEDITVALDNDRKNPYFPNVEVITSNEESNPDDQREHHLMEKINVLSQSHMKGELKKETLKQNSANISIKTNNVKEQMNNCKTLLNKVQTKTYSKDSSQIGVVNISKKSPDHLGKLQSLHLYEKSKVQNNAQSSPVDLDEKIHFYESPDKKHNDKSVYANVKADEIIVLDSSGEDDSEEDTELSDDTMEECRKIFNEFVEREVQKEEITKQALAAQPEADSDSKANLLPGQKRRIAHTAKFDALAEEKAIYDRCGSKNMYLNIAVNTLKKLRNHGSMSSDDFTGIVLYKLLKDYALTEEQLKENGYPEPNPEKPSSAVLCSGHVKPAVYDFPGGLETRYSCCEGVVGSPGCQVAKLHVHDGRRENIDGFVKTFIKPPPLGGNNGVFALDCEMCYTTRGLELSRVTVVDPSLQVVYDTVVKPDNEIIDYNNRFSGVSAEDMETTGTSIRNVQAVLLNLFSADTVLIGHGLESDLFALKLFHSNVVDTSVVFPHRLGFPHKRALRNLIADYLRRIIQDDVHVSLTLPMMRLPTSCTFHLLLDWIDHSCLLG